MDPKQLRMWRMKGVEPCGGAMLSIARFASEASPEVMEILLGEGFQMTFFGGGVARPETPPGARRKGGAAGPEPTRRPRSPLSVGAGGPSQTCNERPAARPIRRCDCAT